MLILPPWYFADETDNVHATLTTSQPGAALTAGANNADGSSVSILSALAHDVHYLVVAISGFNTSAANGQVLADILLDPAGGTSWSSFIDDLICGFTPNNSSVEPYETWYKFPIFIKSGTSIGMRARTAHTAALSFGRVLMWAYGNPSRPDMWWCGQKVESLGINAASSKGTDVTPGASGAYSSWTNIGGATSARYGALLMGLNGSDATAATNGYDWQVGYGSTKLPGSPTVFQNIDTNEKAKRTGLDLIHCDIPQGTQLQMRAACSGASPETINAGLYGVY